MHDATGKDPTWTTTDEEPLDDALAEHDALSLTDEGRAVLAELSDDAHRGGRFER
jgi:hypothetical protein